MNWSAEDSVEGWSTLEQARATRPQGTAGRDVIGQVAALRTWRILLLPQFPDFEQRAEEKLAEMCEGQTSGTMGMLGVLGV